MIRRPRWPLEVKMTRYSSKALSLFGLLALLFPANARPGSSEDGAHRELQECLGKSYSGPPGVGNIDYIEEIAVPSPEFAAEVDRARAKLLVNASRGALKDAKYDLKVLRGDPSMDLKSFSESAKWLFAHVEHLRKLDAGLASSVDTLRRDYAAIEKREAKRDAAQRAAAEAKEGSAAKRAASPEYQARLKRCGDLFDAINSEARTPSGSEQKWWKVAERSAADCMKNNPGASYGVAMAHCQEKAKAWFVSYCME